MLNYTLKVVEVIKETDDASTICFKQPSLKKIKYLSGQYLTVIVNISNRRYKRPYSISSAPGLDNTINITIKRLKNGIVSNYLIDQVNEGDLIEVIEPLGSFTYNKEIDIDKEIFLWGAGSGITPLFSILKTALTNSNKKVTLYYCNKSTLQTIFYKELMQFLELYPNKLSLHLFYTGEIKEGVVTGRITLDIVSETLKHISDNNNVFHYICGPLGLKDTIKNALLKQNTLGTQIFSEDFEHTVEASELKDIQNQCVEIEILNNKFNVEVVKGKSILEAGLDAGIDLPYSCQTGNCTLCKATLVTGKVKILSNEKTDQPLQHTERLLCCSYPLTDNVEFKIY